MRVTFTTVNRNVQRNLSRRYSDMVNLQEQLATGKRLRKPSDNPIDVANDIKLRTKMTQLKQYKRNIEDGLAVMGVAATAMGSMNELLHRARELAVQAANGTYTDSDRHYMQEEVDQIYRQMMSVINTQFKGNYIFNGTNTKTPPYTIAASGSELTDFTHRTMATYGNELEVSLRSGEGHDPADTIFMQYGMSNMQIGDTVQLMWNSVDPDMNTRHVDYIIPESFPFNTYELGGETFNKAVLGDDGKYVGDYMLDYRTGEVTILSERFRDALNAIPPANRMAETAIGYNTYADYTPPADPTDPSDLGTYGGNAIQYSLSNTFQIIEGKWGDDITKIFPGSFKLSVVGKEYIEGFGEYQGGHYDQDGVYHKGENEFDFSVDYETGKITIYNMELLRDMRPEWLINPAGGPSPNPDPDNMYKHGKLSMTFDYITRGTDIYGDKVTSQGNILRAMEEGISATINLGADEMLRDIRTGNDMVGVLLRYSQALLKDDREGIQNALDELTVMYDTVLNAQSQMGARIYRFELTLQRNEEQYVEVAAQQSALEDADLAEVISKLLLAENVYQASLQAAMRVIQPSLANYM